MRNLEGSVGDITHESGAKVRAIFTKQVQDDIFNDIEDLETGLYNHKIDTGDPHANAGYLKEDTANGLYLTLSGGYMKGPIDMGGYLIRNLGVPVQKEDAVTKGYVDDELAYHTSISDAHHARYTDQEAVDAQAGLWLPIHGTADAATKWATARTLTVKLEGDLSGTASTTLDGTANKTITITTDANLDDYYTKTESDDKYATKTALDGYLPLTGGTLTDDLTLPAGSNVAPTLHFGDMAANSGLYGDDTEFSIAFNGTRHFTVFKDEPPEGGSANVVVAGSDATPFAIQRWGSHTDQAWVVRIKIDPLDEIHLTYRALKWLADNHN